MDAYKDWKACNSETFWCELTCDSHVVQLYENDEEFLNLLEDFVLGGVVAEACVMVIATKEHLSALEQRLRNSGLNVDALRASDQFITLDAHETLSRILINGLPDRALFEELVAELMARVKATGRKMRTFGEMVALLWEQGNYSATIMLEEFWNELLHKEAFPLFCAYPKNLFSEDANNELNAICKSHARLVAPSDQSRFDLIYHDVS
jgi:hypothetical protein